MSHHSVVSKLARHYDRLAEHYDSAMDRFEGWLLGDWRAWAAAQAHGRTLEIAIGTGRTLPFYPEGVAVLGVELSAGMLQYARQRARGRQLPVFLVRADAQALPLRNESIDVVVSILSLCTIPDHRQALAEAYRVLRPGGRLVLVEHVRSPHRAIAAVQHLIDPLSIRFAYDHLTREPLELVPQCGFRVVEIQRRWLGIIERILAEKPLRT